MEVVVDFMGFVTGSCGWIFLQWGWWALWVLLMEVVVGIVGFSQ